MGNQLTPRRHTRSRDSLDIAASWSAVEAALPVGWRLDGLRCTSAGLELNQRAEGWRAVAVGPSREEVVADGDSPDSALASLLAEFR